MSELEHVVMGVVWTEQPCTAYAVRRVFQQSPTSYWSGSAGAIYPLMRRLEERGLLRSRERSGDKRTARLYRLTPKGLSHLRRWLRPPLPPPASLMNVDPLRVRVRFLGALPAKERNAMLAEASEKLRQQSKRLEQEAKQDRARQDLYRLLITRGAILSLQAQSVWLEEVKRALQSVTASP